MYTKETENMSVEIKPDITNNDLRELIDHLIEQRRIAPAEVREVEVVDGVFQNSSKGMTIAVFGCDREDTHIFRLRPNNLHHRP